MANLNPMTIPASYWQQCVADELMLAPLMGYSDLRVPGAHDQGAWIFGHSAYTFRSEVGPLTEPTHHGALPRWRRDPLATGSLLEKVPADIERQLEFVRVSWGPFSSTAYYAAHPSDGHALRKALVEVAISGLGARRANAEARRFAGRARPTGG